MSISKIIIHCAACRDGESLDDGRETAAETIDRWHRGAGFKRKSSDAVQFNPHLPHIGYQFVIDVSGHIETGRAIGEVGAHCRGYNQGSIGICLVGTSKFTPEQWDALADLVDNLLSRYPEVVIIGHRDLSPDKNGDGKITPNEWTKTCPGFDVREWLKNDMQPQPENIW